MWQSDPLNILSQEHKTNTEKGWDWRFSELCIGGLSKRLDSTRI